MELVPTFRVGAVPRLQVPAEAPDEPSDKRQGGGVILM